MSDDLHDCRTCRHNTYHKNPEIVGWVSCGHPTTLAKMPRWERGDPEWVNMQTGDIPVSRINELAECPTYEAAP